MNLSVWGKMSETDGPASEKLSPNVSAITQGAAKNAGCVL